MEDDKPIKIYITDDNCEEQTGYSPQGLARLTGIEAYTKDYTFQVGGHNLAPSITVNSSDKKVHMNRSFIVELNVIDNNSIEIKDSPKGTGYRIFAKQVREAKKAGFEKITCIAIKQSGFNGHYTWARFGYIMDDLERDGMIDYLKENGYTGGEYQPHKIVTEDEWREWWRLNGQSWTGTFDLTDGSESMEQLERYRQEYDYKDED